MNQGYSVDRIWELTNIDKWFLNKLQNIVRLDKTLANFTASDVPASMLRSAKQLGFSDRQIATAISSNELSVRRLRTDAGIIPFVKQIDTVAAEFPAFTNYLYMTYNAVEHDVTFEDKGVMVLGSGVYRIGSSVEFDWCAVRAIRTLRGRGVKTVMVNYNPETVSTDYDEADRLYFENINLERILDIYEAETSSGVVIAMGGQTPNNIALPLHRQNVKILGTSPEMIDTAENRYKFSRMLDQINVDQPLWKELTSFDEAGEFCEKVGYPVLVRPSYVLSGAAMNVVYSPDDLSNYLGQATAVSREHPVVISKYIEDAKEIEMDAIAVNGKMVMHVVSEHVENAGVHSGDATLILPPQDLDPETIRKIEVATAKIGQALDVTGCYNIQFIAKDNEIKVIECNLRASRSMPFVSKVMEVDLIEMATNAMLGFPVEAYPESPIPKTGYVGIKVPQFSFSRLSGADPILGVEMASTGEVACFGKDKYEAYIKALVSTGFTLPKKNILLSIGSFKEKQEMLPAVKRLRALGYNLFATAGTADFMSEHGVPVKYLETLEDDNDSQKSEYSLNQHLANNLIDLYINLPSKNRYRRPASYVSKGYRTRRMAVDFSVPLITNVKCAKLFVEALARHKDFEIEAVDYKDSNRTVTLPGLVNIQALIPGISTAASKDFENISKTSISSGFTMIGAMATGIPKGVEDKASLAIATTNSRNHAHCDYFLTQNANVDNANDCLKETAALFISFAPIAGRAVANVAEAAKHFSSWPAGSPIVTDAKGTDLASILLLASLHNRPVHITGVSSADDMALIMMSKDKELQVTCDIEVYSLFLTREETGSKHLPTKAEQDAFWSSLHVFDCFTIGSLPYRLAAEKGTPLAHAGIEETLPLLVDAVNKGRLTMADVIAKLYTNPRKIFSLPEQKDSYVEIETDRACVLTSTSGPFAGKALSGTVHRVVLHGQTAYLDGAWYTSGAEGQDVSSVAQAITKAVEKVAHPAAISTSSVIHSPRLGPSPDAALGTPIRATEARRNSVQLEAAPAHIPQAVQAVQEMPSSIARIINNSPFSHRHILSSKQFDRNELHALFSLAHEMRTQVERNGSIDLLRGKVMCSMFYEPSTRTSCSFAAAMARLGGSVVSADGSSSSVVKGETLADTVRTLGCYGDLIVLRHPNPGSAATAAKFSKVPVINAGDGVGEHPTQAFLDVYTIREELGTVNGLTITLVGDLKNGRTVHSLVKLLAYYHVTLNFVSPPSLRMPESVKAELSQAGVVVNEYTDLNDVIAESDVVYVTRVQKERFSDLEEYERVKSAYVINNKMMSKAKTQMIVMHPLPRVSEIEPEVDFDQRAAYFRQMRYGLYVRMALLALVLGKSF
ncbi:carbamoyl-phosphate synthase small subunit [Podila verticillata NRRL 6337]|nr:carbamoyl-phosphate synthase small subunit [Podila verticillata NRRL 6337]